jgi:hypothetical protein
MNNVCTFKVQKDKYKYLDIFPTPLYRTLSLNLMCSLQQYINCLFLYFALQEQAHKLKLETYGHTIKKSYCWGPKPKQVLFFAVVL